MNYLMEFHFIICTYIWELDTKFESLRVCENRGVTTDFSVYNLHEPVT